MKARGFLFAVLVAVLVLPAAGVLLSDGSDAAEADFQYFYRDQLTDNQKAVYNALAALGSTPSLIDDPKYGSGDKVAEVVVGTSYSLGAGTADQLNSLILTDVERAWQATMLDSPLAWWTWPTDNAGYALFANSFSATSSTSVNGFTFYVRISPAYADGFSDKVSAVYSAIDALMASGEIKGDTQLKQVRSINEYLCSKEFVYSDENVFSGSVYGALVDKNGDGKHAIACMGYSKLFKLVCDRLGIDCVCIVGSADQGNGYEGHMWNAVRLTIDGNRRVLGVDATFNDTGPRSEEYLLCGYSTESNSVTFTQSHQAFAPSADVPALWAQFSFIGPDLSKEGYEFPKDSDLLSVIVEFLPWILVGVICAVLAVVLVSMARRGD